MGLERHLTVTFTYDQVQPNISLAPGLGAIMSARKAWEIEILVNLYRDLKESHYQCLVSAKTLEDASLLVYRLLRMYPDFCASAEMQLAIKEANSKQWTFDGEIGKYDAIPESKN